MSTSTKFVVTVSPFGIVEGSYSLVQTADSWLAGSNIVSTLRDSGAIGSKASVKIVSKA